jgi:hypothetical protein
MPKVNVGDKKMPKAEALDSKKCPKLKLWTPKNAQSFSFGHKLEHRVIAKFFPQSLANNFSNFVVATANPIATPANPIATPNALR